MLHACSGHVVGAIEGHGVAEDDAAAAKRGAERIVGGHGAALEAIRLGEHDVQRDDGCAEIAKIGHEFADHVRRHGHCPTVARLRSSTSMMTIRSLVGRAGTQRTSRSQTYMLEAEQYRGR